jgi:hypothetical protein
MLETQHSSISKNHRNRGYGSYELQEVEKIGKAGIMELSTDEEHGTHCRSDTRL